MSCLFMGIVCMSLSKIHYLKKYHEKRDFAITPEPKSSKKSSKKHEPIFVIHKHAASHLHYDLRLEIDGVLMSWAIPKGPSLNPAEKHLAVETEPHPYEYADFEGVIPEPLYGAGTVMIWDFGIYKNIKEKDGKLVPMKKSMKNGQIEVWFDGQKIKGGYVLVRTNYKNNKKNWLLIKMDDEYASARKKPTSRQNKSALTNRTMTQIKKDGQKAVKK